MLLLIDCNIVLKNTFFSILKLYNHPTSSILFIHSRKLAIKYKIPAKLTKHLAGVFAGYLFRFLSSLILLDTTLAAGA